MQFIRIHRRASAIVATALTAIAVSASTASAFVYGGPSQQTGQAGLAAPPVLGQAQPSEPLATQAQAVLDHSYTVSPAARHTNSVHPKTAATAAVSAPKLAAPSDSFHWGDAAIGAGIAMATVSLVIAVTLVVRRRTQFGEA
ncbi:MAG TPA: hypothetical protein VME22_03680 [Solirubrobacteraceae bacterium]|nr:hypothetical protein [Solirubrobacteraceae bacterium]